MSSILSFYVTYNRLNYIIDSNFKNSNKVYNNCNLIIDLSSSLNSLYYNKIYMKKNEYLNIEILKDILNMIAHYKFGFKKYNINLNFYFIYSNNNPKTSTDFYPYYNTNMKLIKSNNSMITNSISSSLKLFQKIWKFLDKCNYIKSENDSSHIVYKIIEDRLNDNDLNIILTKDPVMYQNIYKDNIIIIRPFKDVKEKKDISYIINNNNKFEYLLKSYNLSKNIENLNIKFNKDRNAIISMMVLSGVRQRSYNKLFKVNETIEIFNKYCELYNTKNIIPIDLFKSFKENSLSEELNNRWKAIDAKYNYNIINDIFEYDVIKLVDREFLYKLNDKYFNGEVKVDEISN